MGRQAAQFAKYPGRPIADLREEIRLYSWFRNFKVFPVEGGLYKQDPELLDAWDIIMAEEAIESQKKDRGRAKKSRGR